MAIERVVVERHLCVESDQFAVARDDQRIDLGERRIGLRERAIQRLQKRRRDLHGTGAEGLIQKQACRT